MSVGLSVSLDACSIPMAVVGFVSVFRIPAHDNNVVC